MGTDMSAARVRLRQQGMALFSKRAAGPLLAGTD